MNDRKTDTSTRTRVLVIILALAVLAAGAWQLGLFERGTDDEMRTGYEAGVTDESGGELIVTDPEAPHVEDVTLPETPMTPVPPAEKTGAAPTAAPPAE